MSIETEEDLLGMSRAGRVVSTVLAALRRRVRPGVSTASLDAHAAELFEQFGARSAPNLFYSFPGTTCISVNEEAVHGVPGRRRLRPGDLVKLDVTAELDGYIGDAAITVAVPPVSPQHRRLCKCTALALEKAIEIARPGCTLRRLGRVIEAEVRQHGFTVLRELTGHGIGRVIHEEPTVPNFDDPQATGTLTEGLVLTIEPIVSTGTWRVTTAADDWTIETADGSPAAHFEHTIVVQRGRPLVLTAA